MLIELLEHENWSVRAEAVEAIGKKLESRITTAPSVTDEAKADAYAALTERLDDPDGFVVGRALTALKNGNLLVALEPLLRVADKHPELAAKVIETLFQRADGAARRSWQRHCRGSASSASHPRVDVRAAVVKVLGDPAEKADRARGAGRAERSRERGPHRRGASALEQAKRAAGLRDQTTPEEPSAMAMDLFMFVPGLRSGR